MDMLIVLSWKSWVNLRSRRTGLQNYSEYRRLPKSGCVVFSADERVAVVRVGDKGFVGAVVIVDHDAGDSFAFAGSHSE